MVLASSVGSIALSTDHLIHHFSDFIETLESTLELLSGFKSDCHIIGDYNINLLNKNDNVINYTNLFYTYSFFQTNIKPTRVTNKSATLIDHVWTNNMKNYMKSGILYTSLSDHFPVFSLFSIPTHNNSSYVHLTKRKYGDDKIKSFKDYLKHHNWITELENTEGADKIFDLWRNF